LNVQFGWNRTHDRLALCSDFSDTPNSASRWHGTQEKKPVFRVELKIAVMPLEDKIKFIYFVF
jgi:hypothetical protein